MMIWKYADGMVQLKITGAEPGKTLKIITDHQIVLSDLHWIDELTIIFRCFRKDKQAIISICRRQGDDFYTLGEQGLIPLWKRTLTRPILTLGVLILLALTLYLPSRVFFFRIEGNKIVPEHRIMEAAQHCGIRFGVSRQAVRSEQMKNKLLEEVPELKWAGINTTGCTAVISVREQPLLMPQAFSSGVSSIVASRDGRILSCTVTRGNQLCKPGQIVQAGELLVSGYTDCGICVRVTDAEGEIFAETYHQMTVISPSTCFVRQKRGTLQRRYSLILGKKRINFWKGSGISDASCDRMYEEYYITLPGGFRLPIGLNIETLIQWDTVKAMRPGEMLKTAMELFSTNQILDDSIAGRILREDHTYSEGNGLFCLKSSVFCSEMIGRVITEEIGETNGKTD